MHTEHKCVYCEKPLNKARVKALGFLGTPENMWAHTACSPNTKVVGLFLGENGCSKLQLCKTIYNDSVTKIFNEQVAQASDGTEDTE